MSIVAVLGMSAMLFGLVSVPGCRLAGSSAEEAHTMTEAQSRAGKALANSLVAKGIGDPAVLAAVAAVKRERFLPANLYDSAYEDRALPIGSGQTISQPFVVAFMTQALGVSRGAKVLEIGTGSGYQAAILAHMGARVYSIEILPEIAEQAADALALAGYDSIALRVGDGYAGWPSEAPFDRVIVTAAAKEIPSPLLEQLVPGGRLVMPVGDSASDDQWIVMAEKHIDGGIRKQRLLAVRFVPLTGRAQSGQGR